MVDYAFKWEKLFQINEMDKLAANDQINRKITFLKKIIEP